MTDVPRPKKHLIEAGRRYSEAWRLIDQFRADRGRNVPDWPNWCFMPLVGSIAVVTRGELLTPELAIEAARLSALAAWRPTQGIYRFDRDLFNALWNTPIDGNIPRDVLYRLPEWCVYIETPGREVLGRPLHGYFAHLEYDVRHDRHEFRLLFDRGDTWDDLMPFVLHLVDGSLADALDATIRMTPEWFQAHPLTEQMRRALPGELAPLLSLVLYLCSQTAEYAGDRRPSRPVPVKTKRGPRLFPPDQPTVWYTGFRLGAALRSALREHRASSGPTERRSPRPHIRSAHWHAFWTGPRSDPSKRQLVLHWLPPIPVNVSRIDEIAPTIRLVKERRTRG